MRIIIGNIILDKYQYVIGEKMNDLRKHIDAYKLLLLEDDDLPGEPEGHALGHGRQEDLEYVEKKVKGVLDRVTLELAGSQAGVFTKLGRRYEQLEAALARLQKKRASMNVDLKSRMVEFFDAEDEVLTRVLKTSKLALTLGKMEKRTPPPKFDSKAFFKEVYALADEISDIIPDLGQRIQELEDKYTEIGEPKEVSPKFGVKVFPDESLREAEGDDWEEFDMRLRSIYNRMGELV